MDQELIYKGTKELTELHNILSKVYFGDIEKYLEYMEKENKDYSILNTSFKEFIVAYQKFFNDLCKVRK